MNILNLQTNYDRLLQVNTGRSKCKMEQLAEQYLRGLFVTTCVLLKDPHYEQMRELWMKLPLAADDTTSKPILEKIFNTSNIEFTNLPEEIKLQLIEHMLKGTEPIPWCYLASETLRLLGATSYDPKLTQAIRTGLTWMQYSDSAIFNMRTLPNSIPGCFN